MSKVLVERELLERIASDDEGVASSADFEDLKRLLAQPAEAEEVGCPVVACISSETGELYHEDYGLKEPVYLVLQSDHLAALSAVTAERDRLREEMAELLEALENLLAVREGKGGIKYHADDIARAAIAKAKGDKS